MRVCVEVPFGDFSDTRTETHKRKLLTVFRLADTEAVADDIKTFIEFGTLRLRNDWSAGRRDACSSCPVRGLYTTSSTVRSAVLSSTSADQPREQ